uniref:Uncharacterized protein n=1 Tax=Nothobranchius furzeri TaxID=105023 RepID=A0A8C6P4U1_NOTFU
MANANVDITRLLPALASQRKGWCGWFAEWTRCHAIMGSLWWGKVCRLEVEDVLNAKPVGSIILSAPFQKTIDGVIFEVDELPSYATATALPSYEEAERSRSQDIAVSATREEDHQLIRDEILRSRHHVFFALSMCIMFTFDAVGLLLLQQWSAPLSTRLYVIAEGFGFTLVKYGIIVAIADNVFGNFHVTGIALGTIGSVTFLISYFMYMRIH